MELKNLKEFLVSTAIPAAKNRTGFLEIIRKQHHENINSNVYAHFLGSEIPEVRSLFLDALLLLVAEKTGKNLSFINDEVSTEVATASGGRIDLVLEDFHYGNVIMIENKIYHYLHNDLLDYWNHYNISPSKKVGILLTLSRHDIPENVKGDFISVTHMEWIQKVRDSFDPGSFTENYRVYISDFINTIETLSRSNTMNESAKFYFENASQVIRAYQTLNEAHLFLNNQFQLIATKIGWQSFGNEVTWRNFWDEDNNIDTYLTIITEDLVNGKKLGFKLILELNRKDKERENEITALFGSHPQFEGKERGESKGTYVHFLCREYTLDIENLAHLSDVVVQHIRNDFACITVAVIKYLYPEKDISLFENQVLTPAQVTKSSVL